MTSDDIHALIAAAMTALVATAAVKAILVPMIAGLFTRK